MSLAPTLPRERLAHIDVLRGLALFGVLLENLQHFVIPSYAMTVASPDAGVLDTVAYAGIRLLCDNKIYAIFSLLFGYGVARQMHRADSSGSGFVGVHLWRMAILFLFGLAHSLLWTGDILATYALLGVCLLPLRKRSDRTLVVVAVLGFALPTLIGAALVVATDRLDAAAFTQLQATVAIESYPMRQSAFAFGAFALGMLTGRRESLGGLADPVALLKAGRRWLAPALIVGLGCNLAALPLLDAPGQGSLSRDGVLLEALLALATPALVVAYLVLALRAASHPLVQPLAATGRMTLTNYLLQSCIGVGILARTGLGPLGDITPTAGVALTVLIFAAQVLASRAWLSRFAYGPAEWVWRAATYGRLPKA